MFRDERIISLFLVLFIFSGCTTSPPLPESLNIIPPSSDVSPEIAAFVGIWEGKWGASQDTIIVVEKIDNQKAEIVFSRGCLGAGGFGFVSENSYEYFTASVLPGPVIEWRDDTHSASTPEAPYQCPCKLTLELTKNKEIMIAYWEYIEHKLKARADLRRK